MIINSTTFTTSLGPMIAVVMEVIRCSKLLAMEILKLFRSSINSEIIDCGDAIKFVKNVFLS